MPVDIQATRSSDRQSSLALTLHAAPRAAERTTPPRSALRGVRRAEQPTPPVPIPPGHVGPVVLPGSGRMVYWTGRVAIGLRHERPGFDEPVPHSTLWVQDLMLGSGMPL